MAISILLFTTLRWVLGAGAERHLINISYSEQ